MRNMGVGFRKPSVEWVGVRFNYSKEIVEQFKQLVDICAWDKGSKTWWFPNTYVPLVDALLRQYEPGYISQMGKYQSAAPLQSEFAHDAPWRKTDHFASMCLAENAPDGLVEVAYRFWRREFDAARGGTGTAEPLLRVEQAYTAITGKSP